MSKIDIVRSVTSRLIWLLFYIEDGTHLNVIIPSQSDVLFVPLFYSGHCLPDLSYLICPTTLFPPSLVKVDVTNL